MKIWIVDRDVTEMQGIEWYLKTYLSYDLDTHLFSTASLLMTQLKREAPDVLLIELALIDETLAAYLSQIKLHIIAITGEPIFQQALKAIDIHAHQLFVKPLPLDQLKLALLNLPATQSIRSDTPPVAHQLYEALYFKDEHIYDCSTQTFFLIECATTDDHLACYRWLKDLPLFEHINAKPLQQCIICVAPTADHRQLTKQLRLLMQEWEIMSGEPFNVAIYNEQSDTLVQMYHLCKHALTRRFYTGYAQVFKSADTLKIIRLDPFLSFEDQQLWITSLDCGDLHTIKQFLYKLTKPNTYYHQEDVRIHLTSILAQIRRYMKKYQLQHNRTIEKKYRELFHFILEHPILYTIIQQLILFTQLIMTQVKEAEQRQLADYTELAVSFIEQHYTDCQLSLQSVATALNISPNYLSNIFSKRRGIPFKKYVQHHRLQQAAQLLISTNETITDIAHAVGFVDNNYFSKVFRAYYQMTPYRYRLQQKAEHW